uniref:G-protein coupled receptors family 1 profile domain-containing protein n=1 Tax=Rhinolophus ferrumequinum TaxID=59479 RepID=A0A671EU77_RHIFE
IQLDSIWPTLNQIALLSGPGPFVLLGLPGEEALHAWISVPMCLLYMAAVAGNALLLGMVAADKTLQAPMYQMLGLLAATNLVRAISTVPKESPLWGLPNSALCCPYVLHCCVLSVAGHGCGLLCGHLPASALWGIAGPVRSRYSGHSHCNPWCLCHGSPCGPAAETAILWAEGTAPHLL